MLRFGLESKLGPGLIFGFGVELRVVFGLRLVQINRTMMQNWKHTWFIKHTLV